MYDFIRVLVIAQAVVIEILYAYAILTNCKQLYRDRQLQVDKVSYSLGIGMVVRNLGVMFLVGVEISYIVMRLGDHNLDARTAVFQFCLIGFGYAWGFVDMRSFKASKTDVAVSVLTEMHKDLE
jgi:Na+-driven multidrug efflux pump